MVVFGVVEHRAGGVAGGCVIIFNRANSMTGDQRGLHLGLVIGGV